jgi:hypothetical protein
MATQQRVVLPANLLKQLQDLQRVMGNPAVSQSVVIESGSVGKAPMAIPSTSKLTAKNTPPAPRSSPINYSYKVRIINPGKKSDVKVRMIHQKKSRFSDVDELRHHLVCEFEDLVPNSVSFDVGFMEGSQQAKVWLEKTEDLDRMYKLYPNGGNVTFWCYGNKNYGNKADPGGDFAEENDPCFALPQGSKRKRDSEVSTRRQEKEDEVDRVYKELREKHGKLESMKLRLWARMICGGLHDNYTEPPDIPAFNSDRKRPKKDNVSEAFTGAAVAICKALSPANSSPGKGTVSGQVSSPSRVIALRMKNYEQLKYLKQLNDDGVLDDCEYTEQKEKIMATLRGL